MARLARFLIGVLLAVCGCLWGCDGLASLRVGLTANPLGVEVEIRGKQAPAGNLNVTTNAATVLEVSTAPAVVPAEP
jgi:hypothetical protein